MFSTSFCNCPNLWPHADVSKASFVIYLQVLIDTGNPAHDSAHTPEKKDVDFFHEITTTTTSITASEPLTTNGLKQPNGATPPPAIENDVTGLNIFYFLKIFLVQVVYM